MYINTDLTETTGNEIQMKISKLAKEKSNEGNQTKIEYKTLRIN